MIDSNYDKEQKEDFGRWLERQGDSKSWEKFNTEQKLFEAFKAGAGFMAFQTLRQITKVKQDG